MPKRGDVYSARLAPTQGSEQSGERPVIVVSRDAINQNSSVVIVVPVTDLSNKKRIYPSHVILEKGDGGLTMDSVALGEQVRAITTTRLIRHIGHLGSQSMMHLGEALKIALDL